MKWLKKLLLLFLVLMNFSSQAREIFYLGRSTKGLLLGDAFTTRAVGEFALFYNPALLGRNNDVRFLLLNPQGAITNAINDLDRFTNLSSDLGEMVEQISGYPIYTNLGIFPYMKMGPFAFSLFNNYTNTGVIRNPTHPIGTWNFRHDTGFIFGAAFGYGRSATGTLWGPKIVRKSKKNAASNGSRASLGFAVKYITRSSVSGDYDIYGPKFLNALNTTSINFDSIARGLGFSKGGGWGLDLGADYVYTFGSSSFAAGLSVLDVGDTRFTKTEGVKRVVKQDMKVNGGVSLSQSYGIMDYTLSLDVHPILDSIEFLRKIHVGLELSLPFFNFYGGYNGGYLSYGTEFNLWVFRFLAGIYGVEVGAHFKQNESSRIILYTSLLDFSF